MTLKTFTIYLFLVWTVLLDIDDLLGYLTDLLHDGVDGVSVDDGEGGEG